jgi:Protein of unknown function (DUF3311)
MHPVYTAHNAALTLCAVLCSVVCCVVCVCTVSTTRAIGGPERIDGMQNGSTTGSGGKQLWYLLLLIPFIATLWVPFYNKMDPQLGGFPFFYWYLLLWVPISAAITGFVYYVTR